MKNYQSLLVVALAATVIISCQSGQSTPSVKEEATGAKTAATPAKMKEPSLSAASQNTDEAKVQRIVSELPEYKEAQAMIDSLTKGKHGVSTMVEKPEKGKTDYTVTVGYNGDERFETYGVYFVNPKTGQVKLYDDMSGQVVTIEAWRNRVGD
jgi:hypothetical protein